MSQQYMLSFILNYKWENALLVKFVCAETIDEINMLMMVSEFDGVVLPVINLCYLFWQFLFITSVSHYFGLCWLMNFTWAKKLKAVTRSDIRQQARHFHLRPSRVFTKESFMIWILSMWQQRLHLAFLPSFFVLNFFNQQVRYKAGYWKPCTTYWISLCRFYETCFLGKLEKENER